MNLKFLDLHSLIQSIYEKLMEHMMDYCNENSVDHLDNIKYLKKIVNKVNNYVISCVICDD